MMDKRRPKITLKNLFGVIANPLRQLLEEFSGITGDPTRSWEKIVCKNILVAAKVAIGRQP